MADQILCWEALDPDDPILPQAQRLYEATIEPSERIPWEWIREGVARRRRWRSGDRSPHLLLAAQTHASVAGFLYGMHVPGYGGYCCYLGVDQSQRRQGIGMRLMRLLPHVLRVDASCAAEALPFVVWESRAPDAAAGDGTHWQARLRLFEKLGAWWISGLTFWAPNFGQSSERAVPLQLFLLPVDQPAEAYDADRLRDVAAGLYRGVYRRQEGDALFEKTLASARQPALQTVAALADGTDNTGKHPAGEH
jgi:GNAT superfamily N-acetyltransferase